MTTALVIAAGSILTLALMAGSLARGSAVRRRAEATQAAAAVAEQRREQEAAATDAAETDRRRLMERVDSLGPERALSGELLRSRWQQMRGDVSRQVDVARQRHELAQAKVQERLERIRAEVLAHNPFVAYSLTVVCGAAAVGLYLLDLELLHFLGLTGVQKVVLAAAAAITIEFLGAIFFASLGVHTIGFITRARTEVRIAVAGLALTMLAALILGGLVPLSASRAEGSLGPELRAAQAAASQVASDPAASEAARTASELTVAELQRSFDLSVTTGALLTSVLALVAFGLSWAPAGAVAHRKLASAKREERATSDQLVSARAALGAFDDEFTGTMADAFVAEGRDPFEVSAILGPTSRDMPAPDRQRADDEDGPDGATSPARPTGPPPPPPPRRVTPPPAASGPEAAAPAGGTFFVPQSAADGTPQADPSTPPDPFDLFPPRSNP